MPSTQHDFVYVLWSPATGPLAAYRNLGVANRHAEAMAGVEVRSLELMSMLAPDIVDVVVTEDYDTDDPTPVTEPPVMMRLEDVEDASANAETRVVDVDER